MKTTAAVLRAVTDRRPYTESRPLSIEEVDLGAPRAGELLVRIAAAGVCHSDVSVVEEVGAGVRDVQAGDHVVLTFVPSCGICAECSSGRPALCTPAAAANGKGALLHGPPLLRDREGKPVNHHLGVSGFARHAVVARESAVVVPKDVPLPVAALFGCAVLTGAGAVLNTASVRPGQSVAVFGLGGVGLAAVMGAAMASAHPIIAIGCRHPFGHRGRVPGAAARRDGSGDGAAASVEDADALCSGVRGRGANADRVVHGIIGPAARHSALRVAVEGWAHARRPAAERADAAGEDQRGVRGACGGCCRAPGAFAHLNVKTGRHGRPR